MAPTEMLHSGKAKPPVPKKVCSGLRLIYIGMVLGALGVIAKPFIPPSQEALKTRHEALSLFEELALLDAHELEKVKRILGGEFLGHWELPLCLAASLLSWLLLYRMGKGDNTARIVFLILFIIGIPAIPGAVMLLSSNPLLTWLGLAQVLLMVFGLLALFKKPASEWFRGTEA